MEDISALESSIAGIDSRISSMYSEPSLKQLEYRLHAVMVHEGREQILVHEINSFFEVEYNISVVLYLGTMEAGHYWAYVLDHKRNVWLKCNDNTVNEATWDELAKESMGGHSNCSAYSLIYINASRPELIQETDALAGKTVAHRPEVSTIT